jgi:hypothetical protein
MVFSRAAGRAFYQYDFDQYDFDVSWLHRIVVNRRRRGPPDPPARFLNGARRGSLEDTGGMPGCEEHERVGRPARKGHDQASAWVAAVSGTDMPFDPGFLDVAETNRTLKQ